MNATPVAVTLAVLAAAPAFGQSVLFVRGAERSGGFFEFRPGDDEAELTEQLADITNASTAGGNHGWFELAEALRGDGFAVDQTVEPLEANAPASGQTAGAPVPFDGQFDLTGGGAGTLGDYDLIVLGSNNAVYEPAQLAAVETYVRGGGGVILISDANFGSNWADASDSDQQFLDRLTDGALTANQDRGTYTIDSGEFLDPDSPIFDGVSAFDGEGVTPVTLNVGVGLADNFEILARAEGQVRRNNNDSGNMQGTTTDATIDDAALLVGNVGLGKVVWHFDRNTFFNDNGAGTDLTRLDNRQYALNLFAFAATPVPEPAAAGGLVALAGLMLRRR